VLHLAHHKKIIKIFTVLMNFLGVEVQAHKLPVSVVDDVWLTGQTLPLKGFC